MRNTSQYNRENKTKNPVYHSSISYNDYKKENSTNKDFSKIKKGSQNNNKIQNKKKYY